jgi:hypothetical protein
MVRLNQQSQTGDKYDMKPNHDDPTAAVDLPPAETLGTASPAFNPALGGGENAKLLSLLALAAGAVAIPNASQADVVYSVDLGASPGKVGFDTGAGYSFNPSFSITNLPGGNKLQFYTGSDGPTFRAVGARVVSGSLKRTASGFVAHTPAGASKIWTNLGSNPNSHGIVGSRRYTNLQPAAYQNEYMAFEFSPALGMTDFGWAELTLAYGPNGPDVTIEGYGYGPSPIYPGEPGAVPEPGQAAGLAVIGAMVLGAAGLRAWRRKGVATPKV